MKKVIVPLLLILTFSCSLKAQDISKLYNRVVPTVVTIMIEQKEVVTDNTTMSKAMVTTSGLGSGVIVSESGEIMTAAHVIEAAERVMVRLINGEEIAAKVVTSNKDADVALIKLLWPPKEPLQVASLANSDIVHTGNQVIVIGAPLGLEHSLSSGIISGRMANNSLSDNFTHTEYFQTDAAINHGNSGGPMFNMNGEVIGIVSFILSESGGFEGIGFAVTSNVAKNELLGKQPFWVGVSFEPIAGEMAKIFNLPQEMGLMIDKVATNSPADIAGIRPGVYDITLEGIPLMVGGDIVLKIGDFDIAPDMDFKKIREMLANAKPNTSIPVKVFRGGKIVELFLIAPRQ